MLAAEWRFLRTGDRLWLTLAQRWSNHSRCCLPWELFRGGRSCRSNWGCCGPASWIAGERVIGLPFYEGGVRLFPGSDLRRDLFVQLGSPAGSGSLADRLADRRVGIAVGGLRRHPGNAWMNSPRGFSHREWQGGRHRSNRRDDEPGQRCSGDAHGHSGLPGDRLQCRGSLCQQTALRNPQDEYCRRAFTLGLLAISPGVLSRFKCWPVIGRPKLWQRLSP